MGYISNRERAKHYEEKQSIVGVRKFVFSYSNNPEDPDDVQLTKVMDGCGKVIIPDFVTIIGRDYGTRPFAGTHYTEIVLTRSYKNLDWAFCRIESSKLKVVCHYTGTISMEQAFLGSENLKSLDLREMDLRSVTSAFAMCLGCRKLEDIVFSKAREFRSLIKTAGMFSNTGLRHLDVGPWFNYKSKWDLEHSVEDLGLEFNPLLDLNISRLSKSIEKGSSSAIGMMALIAGTTLKSLTIHHISPQILEEGILNPRYFCFIDHLVIEENSSIRDIKDFLLRANITEVNRITVNNKDIALRAHRGSLGEELYNYRLSEMQRVQSLNT